MKDFRINEAIARAKAQGIKINKKMIGAALWPNTSASAVSMNMSGLCKGTTKRIEPSWVKIICALCNCTPNYLFGYDDER